MAKYSKQRALILEILRESKNHPTAREVYEQARKTLPNISLGTVYRNLELLAQNGDILNISFGEGSEHFDGNCAAHLHLHCTVCGKTVDAEMSETAAFCAALQSGFTPQKTVFTVYGVCEDCKNNQ